MSKQLSKNRYPKNEINDLHKYRPSKFQKYRRSCRVSEIKDFHKYKSILPELRNYSKEEYVVPDLDYDSFTAEDFIRNIACLDLLIEAFRENDYFKETRETYINLSDEMFGLICHSYQDMSSYLKVDTYDPNWNLLGKDVYLKDLLNGRYFIYDSGMVFHTDDIIYYLATFTESGLEDILNGTFKIKLIRFMYI